MRILLAKDRHQHIGTGDFLLAGRLHVVDGALQYALETQGRLGIAAVVLGELIDRSFDGLFQLVAQAREIGTHCLEHGFCRGIVEQRQQQVFDRHEFMACVTGALVALADAVLEILAEHGGRTLCSTTRCYVGFSCTPHKSFYAFSIVHNRGCWFIREYSFTCATLDSAISRVKTPQTPRPRVCTCNITWVARSRSRVKKRVRISTTKSIGV